VTAVTRKLLQLLVLTSVRGKSTRVIPNYEFHFFIDKNAYSYVNLQGYSRNVLGTENLIYKLRKEVSQYSKVKGKAIPVRGREGP
jgi:hypothetical protein